jgi:hypothetical protein
VISKQESVKEFIIKDGIGAQMYRKIYAMSYAIDNNLPFIDTPIDDFLIHESDKIYSEDEKNKVIDIFNNFLINPWSNLNIDKTLDLCKDVGAGLKETQGMRSSEESFTERATVFNPIDEKENSIVIHIRRGNVIKENPRWIDEEVYMNLFLKIDKIIEELNLKDPTIYLLTDAPTNPKPYKPINNEQALKWKQDFLYTDSNNEYKTTTIDFEKIKYLCPKIKIVNDLSTYDSFLLMIRANVLVVSRSAFSLAAALLSKNNVLNMIYSPVKIKNAKGIIDQLGNVQYYDQ